MGFCNCSVLLHFTFVSILVLQSSRWEKRAGYYAWLFFLVSRDCYVALPHDAAAAVCPCGIS